MLPGVGCFVVSLWWICCGIRFDLFGGFDLWFTLLCSECVFGDLAIWNICLFMFAGWCCCVFLLLSLFGSDLGVILWVVCWYVNFRFCILWCFWFCCLLWFWLLVGLCVVFRFCGLTLFDFDCLYFKWLLALFGLFLYYSDVPVIYYLGLLGW